MIENKSGRIGFYLAAAIDFLWTASWLNRNLAMLGFTQILLSYSNLIHLKSFGSSYHFTIILSQVIYVTITKFSSGLSSKNRSWFMLKPELLSIIQSKTIVKKIKSQKNRN